MYVDVETLGKERLPEADHDVPGLGTVRVRALSRGEVFRVQKLEGADAYERKILAFAMVTPKMTEIQVQNWQEACPAGTEIEDVVLKIKSLSGMDNDADKSGVHADGDEPGSGVRALPSGQAGDDGRGPTGADG